MFLPCLPIVDGCVLGENCKACAKNGIYCRPKSVVYIATCQKCNKETGVDEHQPTHIYIGETARTFRKQVEKHTIALRNLEQTSFQVTYWATCHKDDLTCPPFKFKVLGKYCDALTRQLSEAVNIVQHGSLNKKCKFRVNDLCRLEPMKSFKDSEIKRKLRLKSSELEEN